MSGKLIDGLAALPQPIVNTDRVVVSRGNILYRCDVQDLPQKWSRRTAMTAPTLADFPSMINPNNCQFFDLDDGVRAFHDNDNAISGAQITSRLRDVPAGSWDLQLACVRGFSFKNYLNGGLVLYENATQKLVTFGFSVPNNGGLVHINRYTNPTTYSGNAWIAEEKNLFFQFFRVRKAGTDIEFLYSPDGVCWSYTFLDAIATNFTAAPDKWGFYVEANNSNNPSLELTMDILHWSEVS